MKKLILFFALMLGFVSVAFAGTGDASTGTDYESMIATFAGFASGIVLLIEGIKALFPNMKGLATQLVSWLTGILCVLLLWWLDAGVVADMDWYIALLYGLGASLVANGVADTGLVQWVIGLFAKKSESKR